MSAPTTRLTPERWRAIKELFSSALEQSRDERPAYLDRACASDPELRQQVERLLWSSEHDPDFLESSAIRDIASCLPPSALPEFQPGHSIGHYRIVRPLGSGGMGSVYLAEDLALEREVAIKLLSEEFLEDHTLLWRLKKEAIAASALNHPNILTVYEIGTVDETSFIVTEYIEGETLRQHLNPQAHNQPASAPPEARRPACSRTGLREMLDISIQVASALAAAHSRGIVHRDIKPENVMLRHDGVVKVLDFGLAKRLPGAARTRHADAEHHETGKNLLVGTVAYMSPEQSRGAETVDQRTDIWSAGAVLFESLTGHVPFEGGDIHRQVVAIQEQELPPLARFVCGVPERLEEIVSKALAKDPEERYQTARDLLIDLRILRRKLEVNAEIERAHPEQVRAGEEGVSSARRVRGRWVRYAGAAAVAVAALALGIAASALYFSNHSRPAPPAGAARITPFTSFEGRKSSPAFSPDGSVIAFAWEGDATAKPGIYLKQIEGGGLLQLTSGPDYCPAWTPDGKNIAFARTGLGTFMVPALGGPERRLMEAPGAFPVRLAGTGGGLAGLCWSPDGKILSVAGRERPDEPMAIFLLSIETGKKTRLTSPPEGSVGDSFPMLSPDGTKLAFVRTPSQLVNDIYVVAVEGGQPNRVTFETLVLEGGLAWSTDGQEIIYSSARAGLPALFRVPSDGGAPRRIGGVGESATCPAVSIRGDRLAYVHLRTDKNIWRAPGPLSTAPGSGPMKLIASTRNEDEADISPDGTRIAFVSDRSGSREIWVCTSDGLGPIQLTSFGGTHSGSPRWSPDGRQIAFDSRPEGQSSIYVINAEGGKPRRLTSGITEDVKPDWSRDGKWIYFGSRRGMNWQIWKVPVSGGDPRQVTRGGGYEAHESPDGSHLYFVKREPGLWRMPVDGGQETRLLENGDIGCWALWKDQLCYLNRGAAPLPAIEAFNILTGATKQIVAFPGALGIRSLGLDLSPDGRWLLFFKTDHVDNDIMLVESFH
jgi:eukaryotic-like serine/threonine-protein kinase